MGQFHFDATSILAETIIQRCSFRMSVCLLLFDPNGNNQVQVLSCSGFGVGHTE